MVNQSGLTQRVGGARTASWASRNASGARRTDPSTGGLHRLPQQRAAIGGMRGSTAKMKFAPARSEQPDIDSVSWYLWVGPRWRGRSVACRVRIRPGAPAAVLTRSLATALNAHARPAAGQRLGLRQRLREWLDGVSEALCMWSASALGLSPFRHLRQHTRAQAYRGLRASGTSPCEPSRSGVELPEKHGTTVSALGKLSRIAAASARGWYAT